MYAECTSNCGPLAELLAVMYTVWLSGDHCARVPTPPMVVTTAPDATSETVCRTGSVTTTSVPLGETDSTVPGTARLDAVTELLSALTVISATELPR